MDTSALLERIGSAAADQVQPGMIVGLGTGSTASAFVRALARRVADGLDVTGVPTSVETAKLAAAGGIRLATLDDVDRIDLCIDGADEIDPNLNVTKGAGGALLHEKLVARRADRYLIIASGQKLVQKLGTRLPLPVEVIPLGWKHTAGALAHLHLKPALRFLPTGEAYLTDGSHFILDCDTPPIEDPASLARQIKQLTGVVDHGLFVDMVDVAMTIADDGTITVQEGNGG